MEILNILQTVVKDWWLLVTAFTVGGLYLQGKMWFHGVNKALEESQKHNEAHQKQADEVLDAIKELKADVGVMKASLDTVTNKLTLHELELVRNTEQHSAIVKALEGHVNDNKTHDVEVKASLAVILDRLGK